MIMTEKVIHNVKEYNSALDRLILEIENLKLSENCDSFEIRELQKMKREGFTILNSSSKRKKIEKLFDDFYDEYTYELAKVVRGE